MLSRGLFSRIFHILCCTLLLVCTGMAPAHAAQAAEEKISPDLAVEMQSAALDDKLAVVVTLSFQSNLAELSVQGEGSSGPERVIRGLQAQSQAAQKGLRAMVASRQAAGEASDVIAFWIFDGMALHAIPGVIREMAARADVASIRPELVFQAPKIEPADLTDTPTDALKLIGAPELWALGIRGQGVVVANLDTGVDITHPDLAGSWRGGSNSWFDPTSSTPSSLPFDSGGTSTGHGTATMGIMVGGSASGTAIGVAPDAKWIAARIFNSSGSTTETIIHQSFQWVMDPDGNGFPDDAPQVVNNSWADSVVQCDTANAFGDDFKALVAVGILPIFAAGNYGRNGPSTQRTPASRPEAFPVGSVSTNDLIADSSSRGPNTCGVSNYHGTTIYPTLVAPGSNVVLAWPGGRYVTDKSGTSFAAPHVAGGLALLLSADTWLKNDSADKRAKDEAQVLLNAADDLGNTGADNTYGYGRLNLLRAYRSLFPPSYQVYLPAIQEKYVNWNFIYYFPFQRNP
jgi:serine protease AprX